MIVRSNIMLLADTIVIFYQIGPDRKHECLSRLKFKSFFVYTQVELRRPNSLSIKLIPIRLGGPAHGIVTKLRTKLCQWFEECGVLKVLKRSASLGFQ